MAYSVNLLIRACADYRQIFEYIEKRSPQGALHWETAFEEGLARLADNPLIYGLGQRTSISVSNYGKCFSRPAMEGPTEPSTASKGKP